MKDINTYNDDLGEHNLPDSFRVTPFIVPENFFTDQQEQINNLVKLDLIQAQNDDSSSQVPDGYFEQMEHSIYAKIAESNLKEAVQEDGFTVDEDYFNTLNQNIYARIASDNLKEVLEDDGFTAPEGYFEELNVAITTKIAEESIKDTIGTISFATPDNYFENLSSDIQARLFVEKLKATIPTNGFEVPTDYFDQLSNAVQSKIKGNNSLQETKVIQMPKSRNWNKGIAAAAAIFVIGIGSYIGFNNYNQDTLTISANKAEQLNDVSDEEILAYLAQVSEDDELIHLTKFVSDTDENPEVLDKDIETKDIEEYLNYML